MDLKAIMDRLEKLSDTSLNEITEQIETIKNRRRNDECHKVAGELNELLKPIVDILKDLSDKELLGDCDFLIGNSFVVRDYGEDSQYIDLKY